MHDLFTTHNVLQNRRRFLQSTGMGLGTTALGALLGGDGKPATTPHHPPRARRVIFLFMAGAPSQLDLFDYKPGLSKRFREPLPPSIQGGQRVTAMTRGRTQLVAPSMFGFHRSSVSGVYWSDLLPHLSNVSDKICLVRSLHTNAINHDPGKTYFCTGSEIPGKPSIGAWLSYGLGAMNRDLPDFVVLTSAYWTGGKRNVQGLYSRLWSSGFLPGRHQGTAFQVAGDPVIFLSNPAGIDRTIRRRMLDATAELNAQHHAEIGDPEIRTTIAQQEMAFRMQAAVPELVDLQSEPTEVLDLYGPEVHKPGSFARNCLLARRMIERDVRFVQLFHRGWDHHSILPKQLPGQAYDVDQPSAALIIDLARRGLLDDTLVVFAGEFGRTVYGQGRLERDDYGRDHHPRCFSGWLAGGGIQGGIAYGQTDDFSYNIVDQPVAVRDVHATMLHLLGLDHERLVFPFQGLDQRLTGVEERAHVVQGILGQA
ncbi:MAG: DUF1501 domain-containing protein [bacterium]|nr:DUF1501 domain-containing protein [bacterium]